MSKNNVILAPFLVIRGQDPTKATEMRVCQDRPVVRPEFEILLENASITSTAEGAWSIKGGRGQFMLAPIEPRKKKSLGLFEKMAINFQLMLVQNKIRGLQSPHACETGFDIDLDRAYEAKGRLLSKLKPAEALPTKAWAETWVLEETTIVIPKESRTALVFSQSDVPSPTH